MKKFIIPFICAGLIIAISFNANRISSYIATKISSNPELVIKEKNSYVKEDNFMYVSISEDFIPYSYGDLLNIVYTVINNGWHSFTFYCSSEYTTCVKDMETISNDDLTLTHINNFVHPFNSFTSLQTSILESGEISLKVNYLYTEEQITKVNEETDRIISTIVKKDDSDYDKIKSVHDYIINNTKYDVERNDYGISNYSSYIAYGALFDHLATCNGYTDTMAIILTKLGFINYKIATTPEDISYESTGHIWNAVLLEGKWLHLDLTWDDPVSQNGEDYLYHKYFLVNNEEMQKADKGDVSIEEHNFNKSIYLEFNESIN